MARFRYDIGSFFLHMHPYKAVRPPHFISGDRTVIPSTGRLAAIIRTVSSRPQ